MAIVVPAPPKPIEAVDDEGFFESIGTGLRSIPHLPAALIDGLEDPTASEEELKLRRRALAEASQWVLPLVVTGAIASIPATGGASVLITAVAEAAGLGLGSGLAAAVRDEGEDPLMAGVTGAALGGAFGAGMKAFQLGGKRFADEAAEAAAKAAAPAPEPMAAAVAQDVAVDPSLVGVNAGKTSWNAQRTLPTAVEFPANIPNAERLKVDFDGAVAAAEGPTMYTTAAGFGPVDMVTAAGKRKAGQSPGAAMDNFIATGQSEVRPLTFGSASPPPPKGALTDEMLALQGITPTVIDGAVERAAVIGARDAFAADQVIGGAFGEMAAAILAGNLHKAAKGAAKMAEGVRLSDTWREAGSFLSRALEPARKTLQRMGPAGVELSVMVDNVFDAWRNGAGEHMAEISRILVPFSKKDRIHIGEVMEGLATAKSDLHAQAAGELRNVMTWYSEEAQKLGIRQYMEDKSVREFTPLANYFPHYLDRKAIAKHLKGSGPEFEAVHRLLTESGQSNGRKQTMQLLRAHFSTPPEFRTGPLNFTRGKLNLPYEKDPLAALSKYVYTVRKRIESARVFGSDYKGVLPYYERIYQDGGDWRVAQRIFSAFNEALPQSYSKLIKGISTYNVWTMLSTAGIVQPAQLLNTASMTSYASLVKGLGAYFKDKRTSEYLATKAGVHINEVLQDLTGVTIGDDPTAFFLKYITGLEPLDRANRVVSAIAGRFEVDRLAAKFAQAKGQAQKFKIAERLQTLGVDAAELAGNAYKPTETMYRNAAYKASVGSQHAGGIMDVPEFKTSAPGKIIYQFRSFALQQAGFIEKELLKPARQYLTSGGNRGSIAPLARYAAGLGPSGAVFGEVIRSIKGTQGLAADDPRIKVLENMALAGGFGIYYDALNAMLTGKERFLSFLAGPGVSEAAAYAADIGALGKGNTEALAKHLLRRTPMIGQPLSNYWFFPRE